MTERNQQFDTYDQWTASAELWLARKGATERAICFDAKGRLIYSNYGARVARDDKAFPIRWLWPTQLPEIMSRAEAMATAVVAGNERDPAIDEFLNAVPGLVARIRAKLEAA